MLIKLKKIILINLKKVLIMQDSININNIKFMCFINLVQLLMLNAFIISYMSIVNTLTSSFMILLTFIILNIIT